MGSVIEIGVLQSLGQQMQGNLSAALATLQHILMLAEPEGYVGVFVEEGAAMAQLLSATNERGIFPEYTGKLLAAFPNFAAVPTLQPKPQTPNSKLIEPLSQRELEVLQLIAQGLSNDEICKRLFLALSTVKRHNRLIFDKLQVQRRTEAVAKALSWGWCRF